MCIAVYCTAAQARGSACHRGNSSSNSSDPADVYGPARSYPQDARAGPVGFACPISSPQNDDYDRHSQCVCGGESCARVYGQWDAFCCLENSDTHLWFTFVCVNYDTHFFCLYFYVCIMIMMMNDCLSVFAVENRVLASRVVGGILLPWKRWCICFFVCVCMCVLWLWPTLKAHEDDRHLECACGGESCVCDHG